MNHPTKITLRSALVTCAAALVMTAQGPTELVPDRSKRGSERPVKKALELKPDMRKILVELPLKKALESGRVESPTWKTAGLVNWHSSFEAASAAARQSGKPLLLFQLLGRLDEEFC